jgi:hypothetical protein
MFEAIEKKYDETSEKILGMSLTKRGMKSKELGRQYMG